MLTLEKRMDFLNEFTGDVGGKDPHMPKGLQVRGREEVYLLATGVSASLRRCRVARWARGMQHVL